MGDFNKSAESHTVTCRNWGLQWLRTAPGSGEVGYAAVQTRRSCMYTQNLVQSPYALWRSKGGTYKSYGIALRSCPETITHFPCALKSSAMILRRWRETSGPSLNNCSQEVLISAMSLSKSQWKFKFCLEWLNLKLYLFFCFTWAFQRNGQFSNNHE